MSVPDVTIAAFVMVEFVGDLVGYGEMQVEDAVAAIDGLQLQSPVEGARMVVHKAEAMGVVNARLTLPAAAVVDGDVIGRSRRDVNEQLVFALRVCGVVK